jgi:hypothetical protein
MGRGTWAVNFSYDELYNILKRGIEESRKDTSARGTLRLAYYITLLVQLVNACRIGEAVEAVQKFIHGEYVVLQDGDAKLLKAEVRVEKKRRKEVRRNIYLPPEITEKDLRRIRNIELDKRRIKAWSKVHLGINTHGFRHAGVTKMSEVMGPEFTAENIGWESLSILLKYIQREEADKKLRRFIRGPGS